MAYWQVEKNQRQWPEQYWQNKKAAIIVIICDKEIAKQGVHKTVVVKRDEKTGLKSLLQKGFNENLCHFTPETIDPQYRLSYVLIEPARHLYNHRAYFQFC